MQLKAPKLLALPLELRLLVYNIVLDKSYGFRTEHYLSISLVCHQIRQEVLPMLLRSHFARSLAHLSEWTTRGIKLNHELLPILESVTLRFTGLSLLAVEANTGMAEEEETQIVPFTAQWWEAKYLYELRRDSEDHNSMPEDHLSLLRLSMPAFFCLPFVDLLTGTDYDSSIDICSAWNTFKALRGIRKIWIVLSSKVHGKRPHRKWFEVEQQLALEMISIACQEIREFTFFSSHLDLDFLEKFQKLRLLRFSGFSNSSPEDTLRILKELHSLDTISLYRYPTYRDKVYGIDSPQVSRYISFTPEVLEGLNHLRSFEIMHMSAAEPSLHLTPEMIKALGTHRRSLRRLSLTSDSVVTEEVFEELLNFLSSSQITDLHLQFSPPKKFEGLNLETRLPKTLQKSRLALGSLSNLTPNH